MNSIAGKVLRPTELIISAGAIRNNVKVLMERINGRAKMMAVIKADAYGHGLVDTAKLCLEGGAAMLGVAIVEEGIALRNAGIEAPILVLCGASPSAARAAVIYELSQTVYDLNTLMVLQEEAAHHGVKANIHLDIDTGMTRIGIRGDKALNEILMAIKCSPNIVVEGAYTHFADAVNDPEFTRKQNSAFVHALSLIKKEGHQPIAHAAASAAMLNDETLWHDMVRPGIAIYGADVKWLCPELRGAQRLVTRPIRVERVPMGTTVSYGRAFKAERESVIMTLPIGYGDGYPRILSGKAFALVRGKRAPVVGKICMDMTMLDVTDVPGAQVDDEVVLLGAQGVEMITPDELAVLAMTNAYEIMLGFTSRLRRRFDDER